MKSKYLSNFERLDQSPMFIEKIVHIQYKNHLIANFKSFDGSSFDYPTISILQKSEVLPDLGHSLAYSPL